MDIFISWSGAQSKKVAEALHHYLPLIINAIHPWLSSADIDAGARWGADVATKLHQSKVGILCMTSSNLESIWVHFEAGALAKTLENTYVCPYLMGVKPSGLKGPLAQFQAIQSDEKGTRALVETLNRALGENSLSAGHLGEAFGVWWPKLKETLDAIEEDEPPGQTRSVEDMVEELLALARIQARAHWSRDVPGDGPPAAEHLITGIIESAFGEGAVARVIPQTNSYRYWVDFENVNVCSGTLSDDLSFLEIKNRFVKLRNQLKLGRESDEEAN